MSERITISAEQAERVQAGQPFCVDGDLDVVDDSLFTYTEFTVPPAIWTAADKPCPTCDGEGFVPIGQYSSMGCPGGCFGTGRIVTELVTERYNFPRWSLGSFTVEVFPLDDKPLLSTDVEDGAIPAATLRSMGIDAKPGQYAIVATKVEI